MNKYIMLIVNKPRKFYMLNCFSHMFFSYTSMCTMVKINFINLIQTTSAIYGYNLMYGALFTIIDFDCICFIILSVGIIFSYLVAIAIFKKIIYYYFNSKSIHFWSYKHISYSRLYIYIFISIYRREYINGICNKS